MVLPTRIGRLAIIAAGVPLAATMTTMMLASPVAAAPAANAALARPAAAVHHYRTVVTGLRVRRAPHTRAPVVHVLGAAGSPVSVNCFAVGSPVGGDRIWYHIVAPHAGFVAGFYLNTGRDPAAGVPACQVLHLFRTLVTGLRVRQRPSTSAPVVHPLGAAGSWSWWTASAPAPRCSRTTSGTTSCAPSRLRRGRTPPPGRTQPGVSGIADSGQVTRRVKGTPLDAR